MKKQYTEPKLIVVEYELSDVVSASLAVVSGDNTVSAPTNWWD